jgi:sulfur-oxidizing protein SoxB
VKRIRAERPGQTLLLDGGDALQGSATALWSRGEDMLRATNQLGVDVFTAHWEFVYGLERVRELFGDRHTRGRFTGEFLAQNVSEAGWGDRVFAASTVREVGGVKVGVIGQAFPYVPVAHPRRFVPDLTFGIREDQVQALVDELREARRADCVVLLSHNGIAVDLKLAARVSGLDVILGGHTHDGLPRPIEVGRTLVISSGAHGKFLSRLDLDVRGGRVVAHRYRLLPVLAGELPADPDMARLIQEIRAPHEARLGETLAVSDSLLYRRGNFNGTFDEIILDALLRRGDAEVAFSPGFRWGLTILPGQTLTRAGTWCGWAA